MLQFTYNNIGGIGMNKWYRLGAKYGEKYSDEDFYKYVVKNNLCNSFTTTVVKDFKEKHYKGLCALVGLEEETEEKDYERGERIYYFDWGFTNTKLALAQKGKYLDLSDEELIFELAELQFKLFQKFQRKYPSVCRTVRDYDKYTIGTQATQTYQSAVTHLYNNANKYLKDVYGYNTSIIVLTGLLKKAIELSGLKELNLGLKCTTDREKELNLLFEQHRTKFLLRVSA